MTQQNHIVDWEGARFIDRESDWTTRGNKEAIWITKTKDSMNRDEGRYRLSQIYDDLLKGHPGRGRGGHPGRGRRGHPGRVFCHSLSCSITVFLDLPQSFLLHHSIYCSITVFLDLPQSFLLHHSLSCSTTVFLAPPQSFLIHHSLSCSTTVFIAPSQSFLIHHSLS